VLLAYQYGWITPASYDTFTSLALIAFAYISGITTVTGAIFGGLIFTGGLATYALQDWLGLPGQWFSLGAAVLVIVMLSQRQGLATAIFYCEPKRPRSVPVVTPGPPESRAPTDAIDQARVTS
jgi:branched-chain amino acid transport system permease protein